MGTAASAIDAGIYTAEGRYQEAAAAGVGLVPFAKWGKAGLRQVGRLAGREAAEGVVKQSSKQAALAKAFPEFNNRLGNVIHDRIGKSEWAGVRLLHDPLAWTANKVGFKVCFAAGTPLRTPEGARAIEDFRVGDLVLSRDENKPDGLVVAQRVEEVFVRNGLIWHLHVGGQVIRTTAEHPFYAWDRGWVACQELRIGDTVLAEDGRWLPVEDMLDTGESETVYNMRIAEFHTYFVGCDEWGFAVWAHNAEYPSAVGVKLGHSYPKHIKTDFLSKKTFRKDVAVAEHSIHKGKHIQARTEAEAIQFSTGINAHSQYLPDFSNKGLEKIALEKGFIIKHREGYHAYIQFNKTVGYDGGKATSWIRAELSGKSYHGHPMHESRLPSAVKDHYGS